MTYNKKVSYFYEPTTVNDFYAPYHPMIPERVTMTHELVQSYDLFPYMEILRYKPATEKALRNIHVNDYVDYLKNITPHLFDYTPNLNSLYEDETPLFNGVYDYSCSVIGGSIKAASRLNQGRSDICINWAGGMHHAKKRGPSGFCYTNDIAACIVELLRYHKRVLYIDIDVHHGDGVEEYFYDTNRVMTLSFHQYGDFFPGTGRVEDNGVSSGKNYALNVPLLPGITDKKYLGLYKTIVSSAVERYQPEALVLQMGADSVAGDFSGEFNLSSSAHSECLEYSLKFNLPSIVLGGGGYSFYNVAKVWTLETGVALGKTLDNQLPPNSYFALNSDKQYLRVPPGKVCDDNHSNHLKKLTQTILDTLKKTEIAPSVPLKEVPRDWDSDSSDEEDEGDMKGAHSVHKLVQDRHHSHPLEYSLDQELDDEILSLLPSSHQSKKIRISYSLSSDDSLQTPTDFDLAHSESKNHAKLSTNPGIV